MGQRDDSRIDILGNANHKGERLGLLPGYLAAVQEYNCCGKQMELDSAYQSDAKRL